MKNMLPKFRRNIVRFVLASALLGVSAPTATADWPFNPANPRPDIFPRTIVNSLDSYRFRYHRPRYITGKIAAFIEPTSQEAMSWNDNARAGTYGTHRPTCIPFYSRPKPWELLNVGPRRGQPLYGSPAEDLGPAAAEDTVQPGIEFVSPLEASTPEVIELDALPLD